MQTSALPSRMPTPFADNGTKNTIPVASQVGVTAGLASFTTGFPPLTMTPIAAGGVSPFGADFNGILNAITQALRWANAGMGYPFDSAFATSVNGYPKGALLPNSTFSGFWLNTAEANNAAPDVSESSSTGWVPMLSYGSTTVVLTSSSVTLTSMQAAKDRLVLSGALTANVSLYLPTWSKKWTIINNCTGAFSVTVTTPAGTGVTMASGTVSEVYGDGTSIQLIPSPGRLLNIRVFDAVGSYIYTPTTGTSAIVVEVQGGGGGGGGVGSTGSNQVAVAPGGNAGSYARSRITSGFAGVNVVVGQRGFGATAAAGGNGGTSSFGSFVTAPGGEGGTYYGAFNAPVVNVNGTGQSIAVGGNIDNRPGGRGAPGCCTAVNYGGSGDGGASVYGAGGPSAPCPANAFNNGNTASAAGAGGSGAVSSNGAGSAGGGHGGVGKVVIWEYA